MTKIKMTNESLNDKPTKKFDIQQRAFECAVRTAHFVNHLSKTQTGIEYGKQLLRASASVGANLEEADGSLSKKDFVHKVAISRREARESRYWLMLIERVMPLSMGLLKQEASWLINEAKELMLILSSIVNKVQNPREPGRYDNDPSINQKKRFK